METKIQHHCVWSYADYISQDISAIYSYVDYAAKFGDTPKRYTIEFRADAEGKFYVAQAQGRYDAVNSSKIASYIEEILKKKTA